MDAGGRVGATDLRARQRSYVNGSADLRLRRAPGLARTLSVTGRSHPVRPHLGPITDPFAGAAGATLGPRGAAPPSGACSTRDLPRVSTAARLRRRASTSPATARSDFSGTPVRHGRDRRADLTHRAANGTTRSSGLRVASAGRSGEAQRSAPHVSVASTPGLGPVAASRSSSRPRTTRGRPLEASRDAGRRSTARIVLKRERSCTAGTPTVTIDGHGRRRQLRGERQPETVDRHAGRTPSPAVAPAPRRPGRLVVRSSVTLR